MHPLPLSSSASDLYSPVPSVHPTAADGPVVHPALAWLGVAGATVQWHHTGAVVTSAGQYRAVAVVVAAAAVAAVAASVAAVAAAVAVVVAVVEEEVVMVVVEGTYWGHTLHQLNKSLQHTAAVCLYMILLIHEVSVPVYVAVAIEVIANHPFPALLLQILRSPHVDKSYGRALHVLHIPQELPVDPVQSLLGDD